jgi:hypothetical protein
MNGSTGLPLEDGDDAALGHATNLVRGYFESLDRERVDELQELLMVSWVGFLLWRGDEWAEHIVELLNAALEDSRWQIVVRQ